MSELHELQVGHHIAFLSGFPFTSEYFDQQEGIQLIRIRDLVESNEKTYYKGAFDSRWLIKRGDILIGMDGDFTVVRWHGNEALLNQRILKAEAKPDGLIDQGFFFYWCVPYLAKIHTRTSATTVKHLSVNDIDRAKGLFPKKAIQRRITEILSTVDEAIEQTEALVAKYQQIKAGLMHDLFTRGVTSDGQLRPTHAEAPHLYKESPLGWIPKEWEVTRLDSVAVVDRGKFTIRPRNDPRFYGGQYPFIQTGDVALAGGRTLYSYFQSLNELGLSVSRLFPSGTIMVTIAANIADTCILGMPMCAPDSLVGVQPKTREDVRFIELSIRRRKSWLESRAPQTAQRNINLEDLRPLLISWPDPRERSKISEIYETQDAAIKSFETHLKKLQKEKHGLMHDLLTGRVRVQVERAETPV